jgi:serine/threonine protein kinase
MRAVQREINVMGALTHPNIVQYLGAEVRMLVNVRNVFELTICRLLQINAEEHKLFIFQEFVSGGSIRMLLNEFGAFEDSVIREYTRQILNGLIYLHQHHIIHGDIKGKELAWFALAA